VKWTLSRVTRTHLFPSRAAAEASLELWARHLGRSTPTSSTKRSAIFSTGSAPRLATWPGTSPASALRMDTPSTWAHTARGGRSLLAHRQGAFQKGSRAHASSVIIISLAISRDFAAGWRPLPPQVCDFAKRSARRPCTMYNRGSLPRASRRSKSGCRRQAAAELTPHPARPFPWERAVPL
jgi:hypothetical protein